MKRGYLTYEELNDALPDDLVASKDIDDLMMMFVELDIMVIDEANREEIEKVRRIREMMAGK
jgi:RNA polymerase primary sigma factor